MGVSNMGVKRSSPEPMDNGVNRGQMQKKPKVQKKKKKRDPNEPQKYEINEVINCKSTKYFNNLIYLYIFKFYF